MTRMLMKMAVILCLTAHLASKLSGAELPASDNEPEGGRPPHNDFAVPRSRLLPSELPPEQPHRQPLKDFKSLLRPRLTLSSEWQPRVSGVEISSHDLSVKMPVYPVFGPPPPFISFAYSFTRLDAPAHLDLPSQLYEFSLGMAWMRRINQKWMARFMFNGAFASDLHNTSGDAWQIRAGGFALYRPNDQWTFAFGALATGRDDIPVLPAIGATWQPSTDLKINLMLPNPRISYLVFEDGRRQHWGYLGAGISGGTWAYDRADRSSERLSYRSWRLVVGWESTPPQEVGTFRPSGLVANAEVGYAFARKFEFDRSGTEIPISEMLFLRVGLSY